MCTVRTAQTQLVAIVGCAALIAAACSSAGTPANGPLRDDVVTVASFNFPESEVLAEIYAQAMEGLGFPVERQLDLGTRELVEPALQRGLVDLVPEYAGSALTFLTGAPASADSEATARALRESMAARGIMVLLPAPASDQNGFAVTQQTATEDGLRTLGDLGPVAPNLVFGGPPECQERPLCLPGLRSTYGLRFKKFVPLDESGPVTAGALVQGQVDVALLFTTDGQAAVNHFVFLRDDLGLQPAENVVPVIRDEVIRRFGDRLVSLLNAVSAGLTTADLRAMNADVVFHGAPAARVAGQWLRRNGFATPRE